MKRKMKRLLLAAVVAAMASTAATATVLSVAPADAETQTSRFAMVEGAGIRYSQPLGLRFIAELGEKEYAELQAGGEGTKQLGMFIMPYEYIDTNVDGTIDVTDYASVETKLTYTFYSSDSSVVNKIYAHTDENGDTYYRANGVISDLKLKNYAREFVGIGYIAETKSGVTTYEYTNICKADNARAATYVAVEAHADPYYAEAGRAKSAFKQYIDGAQLYAEWEVRQNTEGKYVYEGVSYDTLEEIKTQIGTYDYTLTLDPVKYVKEGGTAQLSTTISDATNGVTFEGAHAVYTSSDESIVKVDATGKLTWVKNGTATITAEFMDEKKTCDVISGAITFDNMTNVPGYFRGSRIQTFSVVDDTAKAGKAMRAQTTSDSTGDTAIFIKTETLGAFFEYEDIEYLAFDVMTDADRTTLSDNLYNVTYHDYRTGAGKWTRYENGNHKYNCIPSDAFKTYYFPRAVYQSWVDNNLTDARFILAGPAAKVCGGDSFYIDNLRGATAEEYANSHWSFEKGNLRTDNGDSAIFYSGNEGGWDLNFSNLYATTAKFTNTITSDGGRAFTFQKKAGTTKIVLNHTTDTAMEKELRAGGYIAYDLYVPGGSNASAVQDNASGVYATLKQGWNTLYAKVDATDNVVSAFWDSTESTYVIDNIRFVTEEEYNTEMLSFEGKAGVLRDSTSDAKSTVYIYTPRDMLANRWTMVAQGDGCMLSNQRYDTEIVKDGKQSFAFHKANNYMYMSLNTGGEMYSLLKDGFTFWVYADLDEQPSINGTSANNFIDGGNNKFNGGAGIKINAREWTQVVVTEDNINGSGRFLIIQGSTAGTYYFDGFEPLGSSTSTITYDAGDFGTVDSATQTAVYGFDYTLKTPTAYRDFLGWYNGDELMPMTGTWNTIGNVTLTAKYSDKVSFENGAVPTYFTKADNTQDISVVDGGTDGNKMLQLNANNSAPAMKTTIEFLASFFKDSNVDYIAFDAKATKNSNNFRRDTQHSNGSLNTVTYEQDMTFTNPVDNVTYPTTGVRADGWKTFYFTRADYDFWVSQSVTSARFIASGGFASGDKIYIDNVRPATAEEYSLSGYSFESVGIRVNDASGVTLLFYTLGNATTWQFNMGSKGFTNVGLTSEYATDGNSALTFTKAAGSLDINLPSNKHPYADIVTKTGYWAIDVYAPVGAGATVTTGNTLFSVDGTPCDDLVEGAWTTVYVAGNMNKLSITDTNGGTYFIDNMRSVTEEEYNACMPEYFYKATGERASNGTVTALTLNGGTHNAGTTESSAMPIAADHTTDMAYYRFHGNYGLNDFLVFDITGGNMPIVSFFTNNVKNSVYNHEQSDTEKAWIFFNGIYNHNGLPDGGYSGNLSNRLNLIGPYKITYKADNSASETPKSNRLSDGSNPTSPSPASLAMLNGTTDEYRVMLGWVESGSNMNLRIYVWNLTTGALLLDKAFGNVTKADWEGDIVLYGHFGKTTLVNKVYPIVEEGFDKAKQLYTPAMQTYKATWDGNGLTLGKGFYESSNGGSLSRPNVGSTDMSYIAFNGNYGVGDYVVFDFTGENMPIVSFFNNEVTNTVYNNASVTADKSGIADANAHGIVICGGMYDRDGNSGLGAVGTNVNSCRLIIVGNQKVLGWDDNSNSAAGGYRTSDGTTAAPNPLSITGLQDVTDTYRVIMGFSSTGTLEVRVINMTTGEVFYNYTKTGLTSKLSTGSIALHGQFGKETVLDSVFGIEEDTTVDALLEKYAKDTNYEDEAAVELDRYAYSGPSNGTWKIDGTYYHDKHVDGSTCGGFTCTCTETDCTNNLHCTAAYVDNRNEAQYNRYKDAGFNILLAQDSINVSASSWATDGKLIMDKAYEAGLKVILTDGRLQNLSEPITISGTTVNGTAWEIGEGKAYSNQASLDAYVMSCLRLYKDHPAFYGVMLGDEPSYQNAWCYGQVYQSIKRVMPECYVQYNLNPLQHDNYNMVKYWYDGSTPARSTPTNEETEAAYKNYVKAFLDAMGTDYIQYDDYPFKSECNNNILGICRSDTTYVDPTALRNIQIIAEIAQERNLTVKVVTQSCHMTDGKSGHDRIRQITEEDARWLNNYLMGFGVKQISYFTYWTKAANSATGETFIDGGSFVNRNGEKTALYDIMKAIMTENTAFAKTISHFDYSASNVVTGSKYQFASDHITWGTTMTSGSFKWLTGATTSTDATLVTELYDKEKYNYMYMVMNTIDPYEQNTNGKDTKQTITITLDASVTSFYVYQPDGTRTEVTGNNTYTVTLTAGQAIYLMPML